MKLSDLFGPGVIDDPRESPEDEWFITNDKVGLEIEAEHASHNFPSLKYWGCKSDGSLRNNGVEVVTKVPLGGDELRRALTEFDTVMGKGKFGPIETNFRTGFHVHLDVRDLSLESLRAFVNLYYQFEDALYVYADRERKQSNFCGSLHFSKSHNAHVKDLNQSFLNDNLHLLEGLIINWDKYSGLNIHAARTQGSIEFRQHPGTLDVLTIARWVNIILCLKDYARKIESCDALKEFLNMNPRDKLLSVFGNYSQYLEYWDLENDIKIRAIYLTTTLVDQKEVDDMLKKRLDPANSMINKLYGGKKNPTQAPPDIPLYFNEDMPGRWERLLYNIHFGNISRAGGFYDEYVGESTVMDDDGTVFRMRDLEHMRDLAAQQEEG